MAEKTRHFCKEEVGGTRECDPHGKAQVTGEEKKPCKGVCEEKVKRFWLTRPEWKYGAEEGLFTSKAVPTNENEKRWVVETV